MDPTSAPTDEERALLTRFVDAWERGDAAAVVALMRDDVRWAMPPTTLWFDGRASIAKLFELYPIGWEGDVRLLATAANRQPAVASYVRPPGASTHRLAALDVLRIEDGMIAEITRFEPVLVHAFNLPPTL